jgi:hypothetical protein
MLRKGLLKRILRKIVLGHKLIKQNVDGQIVKR